MLVNDLQVSRTLSIDSRSRENSDGFRLFRQLTLFTFETAILSGQGPQWLTGRGVGPDGSMFAFVVLTLLAGIIYRAFSSGSRNDSARSVTK